MEGLTLPIDEYEHEIGINICGGYVYRGYKFPSLQGYYIFGDWNGKLYRELKPAELRPFNVKFIPYSVWQNRGRSEMSVWLPRAH
jgi:hypothetical protein